MGTVLLGLAALAVLLWALNGFASADPRKLLGGMRAGLGATALASAVTLAAIGRFVLAIPLALAGLALLGLGPSGLGPGLGKGARPGQVSRVRSAFIEMELDHDSGALRGQVIAGTHAGQTLDALELPALIRLLGEIDEESQALLATYLDRRQPRWREHAQGDAAAGRGGAPSGRGPMTEQEAYQILGLEPGASAELIGRAHRTLMKKLHPDQGGTTYLAARVNEAKDVLLRRHR